MLVIARDLNTKIDKKEAYKAPDGKYYSCENGYYELVKEQKRKKEARRHRDDCIDMMYLFMEYGNGYRMPMVFFKRLKDWIKWGYSYEEILESMKLSSKAINRITTTKEFESETGKLFYLMGVIQNSLNDGKKSIARKQKAIDESVKTTCPEDINIDVGVKTYMSNITQTSLLGDISEWT